MDASFHGLTDSEVAHFTYRDVMEHIHQDLFTFRGLLHTQGGIFKNTCFFGLCFEKEEIQVNVFLNNSRHTYVKPGGGNITSRRNDTSPNQKPDDEKFGSRTTTKRQCEWES